jgi:hypothetical protein
VEHVAHGPVIVPGLAGEVEPDEAIDVNSLVPAQRPDR